MKRREFLYTAFIGLNINGLYKTNLLNAQTIKKPNILFIMTDQQNSRMMSCTGNKYLNTPAMDSIANEGIRFENGYTTDPVCVPSRISMATGMMPGRLSVFRNKKRYAVPQEVKNNSLGKLMKRAGYDTFYGGKVHMCKELTPENAGYDVYFKNSRDELPDEIINFISQKREKPFFAVASFINPHDICHAHKAREAHKKNKRSKKNVNVLYQQVNKINTDELPPLPANYSIPEQEPEAIEANLSDKSVTPAIIMRKEYSDEDWRRFRWIYCRLTEVVDNHIGRILKALKENGLEENTVIIFTSDHGDMDSSHKLASKYFFYDESVKVPFLIKYKKKIPAGQVKKDFLVSTGLDILPTCCYYAGIEKPSFALGYNLGPLAEKKRSEENRDYVAAEISYARMIRSKKYKYCVYDSGKINETLIDMENDPGELNNLALDKKYKKILDQHRAYMQDWIKRSNDKEAKAFTL